MATGALQEKMASKQRKINGLMDEHGIITLENFEEYTALSEELRQLRLERREERRRPALNRHKVPELREILKNRGLAQTGKKSELIDRIREDDTAPASSEEE